MKKAVSLTLLMIGLGQAALASHPHDRVCVGSTESVSFVFQYSIGRTYENGDSNLDPHKIASEAAYSSGDYMSNPAEKFVSEAVTFKPKDPKTIPLTLKSAKGETLFTGTFDFAKEQLTGKLTDILENKTTQATVKLNCISHPRLTLESTDQDIAE